MTTSIKQIEEIIQRLPIEKLESLLKIARDIENEELSLEDVADIEAGKTEIERGEWVSLDEFCRQKQL
jgi:exonuclease VII small subunit